MALLLCVQIYQSTLASQLFFMHITTIAHTLISPWILIPA
jgi:hypothetical protein